MALCHSKNTKKRVIVYVYDFKSLLRLTFKVLFYLLFDNIKEFIIIIKIKFKFFFNLKNYF